MFVYNVTVSIDSTLEQEWLQWMKEVHIPEVLETGCFIDNKMFKVITEVDTGSTYSIQYFYQNEADIIRYRDTFAAEMQRKHTEKYKDKFVAFRTILQQI
jgi:hypothetical protein